MNSFHESDRTVLSKGALNKHSWLWPRRIECLLCTSFLFHLDFLEEGKICEYFLKSHKLVNSSYTGRNHLHVKSKTAILLEGYNCDKRLLCGGKTTEIKIMVLSSTLETACIIKQGLFSEAILLRRCFSYESL